MKTAGSLRRTQRTGGFLGKLISVSLLHNSEFVELFLRGVPIFDGERALPGRGTAFLEKPWEKHQGFHPWTPNVKPEAVCSGSFNW